MDLNLARFNGDECTSGLIEILKYFSTKNHLNWSIGVTLKDLVEFLRKKIQLWSL